MTTMISRCTTALLVGLFIGLLASTAAAAPVADHEPAQANETANQTANETTQPPLEITGTYTGYLTPGDDDHVRWKATLTIPKNVSRVVFQYRAFAVDITSSPGSVTVRDESLVWTGSPDEPTAITITAQADSETSIGPNRALHERDEVAFTSGANFYPVTADTTTNQSVTANTTHETAGVGHATPTFAVFGPHIEQSRTFNDTRVTVVFPVWMDGWEEQRAIALAKNGTVTKPLKEAYYGVRQTQRVTDVDSVTVFAVGDTYASFTDAGRLTADVSIAASGTRGPGDRVFSEITHTGQDFTTTTAMHWLIEGMDRYYAKTLEDYADVKFTSSDFSGPGGAGYDTVDLREGDSGRQADYERGQTVLGHLQARIYLRTNGTHTFFDVWEGLNDHKGTVSISDFEQIVYEETGVRVGNWFRPALRGEADIPSNPVNNSIYRPPPFTQNKSVDLDGDGLTMYQESQIGSSDFEPDTDFDRVPDRAEYANGTDPTEEDTDGDKLIDFYEITRHGTDPTNADTDGDGIPDEREVDDAFDEPGENEPDTNATLADTDGDGLDDGREVNGPTNATVADTDGDGLEDGAEIKNQSDPTKADTDEDGLLDGEEVKQYETSPITADTDYDGLEDYAEITKYGTNPTKTDTDGDGLTDFNETQKYGTDPTAKDSDNDGLPDAEEIRKGLNATAADTDGDGVDDLTELEEGYNATNPDSDGDGLRDGPELDNDASPLVTDSDKDGLSDGEEVNEYGTDPRSTDTDGDGLQDGAEVNEHGTDPTKRDTDGDGVGDGREIDAGTDPTDPDSVPDVTQTGTATPADGTQEPTGDTPGAFEDNEGDTYAPAPGLSVLTALLALLCLSGLLVLRRE